MAQADQFVGQVTSALAGPLPGRLGVPPRRGFDHGVQILAPRQVALSKAMAAPAPPANPVLRWRLTKSLPVALPLRQAGTKRRTG